MYTAFQSFLWCSGDVKSLYPLLSFHRFILSSLCPCSLFLPTVLFTSSSLSLYHLVLVPFRRFFVSLFWLDQTECVSCLIVATFVRFIVVVPVAVKSLHKSYKDILIEIICATLTLKITSWGMQQFILIQLKLLNCFSWLRSFSFLTHTSDFGRKSFAMAFLINIRQHC